ncbi:MAG TPA: AI-2E family transporter [Deinococcales bacterium]|nr:AI-2E family transporter [Deinococcales bacterium]
MQKPAGGFGREPIPDLLRTLIYASLFVLALLLLGHLAGAVAAPLVFIVLAGVLAMGLNPLVVRLETTLKVPRSLAASIVMLAILGGLVLLLWLVVPMIVAQAMRFSENMPAMMRDLQENLVAAAKRYRTLAPLVEGRSFADPTRLLQGSNGMTSIFGFAGAAANAIFSGVLLVMLVAYLLASPEPIIKSLVSAFTPRRRAAVESFIVKVGGQLGAWLVGNLIISLIIGAMSAVALAVIGFEDALLFAAIVAVTDLVPVIGPIIGMVPPVLVALASGSWDMALWAVIALFVIQQVESYAIAPFIYGRAVRLHPASLVVGVLVFGSLLGLAGIFLTVPLLIIIKAVYEEVYLARMHAPAVAEERAEAVVRAAGNEPEADPAGVVGAVLDTPARSG